MQAGNVHGRKSKGTKKRIGGGGQLLNLARVKPGEERKRGRQGHAQNARLFSTAEARALLRDAWHREVMLVAWSQALFCEALIKKTKNFSFF